MKINLDKSSDGFPFILCLLPVFLVSSHFAPTKIPKEKLLQGVADSTAGTSRKCREHDKYHGNQYTDDGNAFCNYKSGSEFSQTLSKFCSN